MKTKSIILIFVTVIALSSCGNKEKSTSVDKSMVDNTSIVKQDLNTKEFSNPVFIYGSSFGNYFQALYKIGKFDEMLKFTSSGSISKYGKANILKMYETMDFAYSIKLKSKTGTDTIVLNYEAGIFATRNILRIPVIIENDTVKIVLKNLKSLR